MAISLIDAVIGVAYLLAMIAMGIWLGRGQRDLSGYFLGGRDLPWWAILGSIVATETSTATFLSVPGIAYAAKGDMRFLQIAFGYIIGRTLVALLLVPQYFKGNLLTAYELLEIRFGGGTKKTASLLFLTTRNLGDGLRLFLAGLALEKVLGMDLIPCVVVIGIATIVYTFVGGMKAVVWSDCIQFVIYMFGGLLALALITQSFPGGWNQLLQFGEETGRFRWLDTKLSFTDPYTIAAGVVGGTFLTLGTHGTDQMIVQRYLSAKGPQDAALAVVASGFVVFIQFALFLLLGVALACFYTNIEPQTFDSNDEVLATYIVEHLPIGLVGITLAAVFAAAMSTLSSSLNSSAASAIGDFYAPVAERRRKGKQLDDHLLGAGRWATVAFGILQIGIGIGASYLSTSVVSDALAIAGFTAGILLGVFTLGFATKIAHQQGVLIGIVGGVATLTMVRFGTEIAWPWYAVIGAVTTSVLGALASLIIPDPNSIKTESLP